MAVSFVRTGNSGFNSGTLTSQSISFDATGCDFLVAFLTVTGSSPAPSSLAATYNSVSMTLVSGSPFGPNSGESGYVWAFYLASPTTGTNTLSATWANAGSRATLGAIGLSGALSVSSIQSTTNSASSPAVTSAVGNLVLTAAVNQNGSAATLTSGTTDWNGNVAGGYGSSGGHISGASSVTPTYSATEGTILAFNVTVTPTTTNLTGVSGTGSPGTVTPGVSSSAVGVAGTGTVGTVTAASDAVESPVSGVHGVSAIGTVFSSISPATLTGVSGQGEPGIVIAEPSAVLEGVYGTGQVSAPTASTSFQPLGVSGTGEPGFVLSHVLKQLTGVTAIGVAGDVYPVPPAPRTRPPLFIPSENGLPASLWLGQPNGNLG